MKNYTKTMLFHTDDCKYFILTFAFRNHAEYQRKRALAILRAKQIDATAEEVKGVSAYTAKRIIAMQV